MSEPEQKEAESQPSNTAAKLKELLSEFPNAPSEQFIEQSKATHGDVFVSALSDDEVFVFRSLTRREHRDINARMAEGKLASDAFEDEVIKVCVLWKSVNNLDAKAGTVPALCEQIMQNSNFLSSALLSQLVTKL